MLSISMSALPPKADIRQHSLERPLSAMSGHWQATNQHRNMIHRDVPVEEPSTASIADIIVTIFTDAGLNSIIVQ
jgi:hypothetical protein